MQVSYLLSTAWNVFQAFFALAILSAVLHKLRKWIFEKDLVLKFKRSSTNIPLPERATPGAAGYDIMASVDAVVHARDKAAIETGLAIELPKGGYYGRIAPRSGLAVKHFIDVGAGVIDSDFRGTIKVILFNFSEFDFKISRGDRIAQLIIEKHATPMVIEVDKLRTTTRGVGGFGSTGK